MSTFVCTMCLLFNVSISFTLLVFRFQSTAGGQVARGGGETSEMRLVQLKCEHLANPLGIEAAQPRLSWVLESDQRGQVQIAYQILVSTSLEKLGANNADKWDSGKIDSDNSVEIPYQGSTLASGERYYWKVRVWDKDKRPCAYSAPSFFEMGLLKQSDWHGKWIGSKKGISAPLLRREFRLEKKVKRARVYISGLGYYELYVNGNRVGDHVLDPASTYYTNDQPFKLNARVLYVSYDVTDFLRAGPNAIAVMLGHGWYSAEADIPSDPGAGGRTPYGDRPSLILQMNVDFTDGQSLALGSDQDWKSSAGPITYNDLWNGETYDAGLEQPGWNEPGFDDTAWEKAVGVKPPGGALTAQVMPPARVVETLKPARMLTPKDPYSDGTHVVYDFGQNFSGWARIRVSGPRGAKLTLKYGAEIYPEDDTLDARSNLNARQTDTYILKGKGVEEWEPRFTLHGFRYVEVQGFRHPPSLKNIEGRFVRSSLDSHGTFACSNDLLNKIHRNIQWTFMSSFQGILQDAAERAERVAWLGDPSFVAEDYIYNYDMSAFWEKWLNDIRDSQKENGDVPFVSPLHWRSGVYAMWPVWKSTYPIIIWYLYQYYGDQRVLQDHYDSLKKLVEFLGTNANNYILSGGLGDHMEPGNDGVSHSSALHTPAALTSTAYYYYDSWILSRVAEVLGKTDDAKHYAALAQSIKEAFNRQFFDKESNRYSTGSQTSNSLALHLQIVPEEKVNAVMKNLVDDIVVKHQGHLSTGIVGSNALAQVLPQHGAADVMYQIATQTTYPSLGYQVSKGATTVCETYECSPRLSQNMKMLGSVDKFFYRNLAGIGLGIPGFRRIIIKPQPLGDLRSVSASLQTVRGPIRVEWVRADTSGAIGSEAYSLDLNVSLPVGTEADISIPKLGLMDVVVTESGKTIWKTNAYIPGAAGLTSGVDTADSVMFHASSGSYNFSVSGASF